MLDKTIERKAWSQATSVDNLTDKNWNLKR